MKMLKLTGAFALLAFTASVAAADAKAPAKPAPAPAKDAKPAPAKEEKIPPPKDARMGPPKPGPEMDKIKGWVGNWKCKGTTSDPGGQAIKTTSTIKVTKDLDGFWLSVVYTRAKNKELPMQFVGHAAIGWDSVAKSYAFIGVDNMGGWINLHAPDALAWTGDVGMMGQKAPATYTFTSPDPKHLTTVLNIGGKEVGKDECAK
jgi:hypothetical protein